MRYVRNHPSDFVAPGVSLGASTRALQAKVATVLLIPVADQRLVFRNQPLSGEGSLASFGVREDALITVEVQPSVQESRQEQAQLYLDCPALKELYLRGCEACTQALTGQIRSRGRDQR